MDISIREFSEADMDAVVELVRALQSHESQFFDRLKPPQQISTWYVKRLLADCEEQQGVIFVAEQDSAIVGYAAVLGATSSEEAVDEVLYSYATVLDLAVAPSVRRTGVATRLLAASEDFARQQKGVHWLRVSALAANIDAVATYESCGFKPLLVTMEKAI